MCRIFGFRSILESGVHKSLMDADNAIIQQSNRHPDGWGVAYFNMGTPHLVKLDNQAKECKIFQKVSGLVASNTLITHIRKSTIGSVGPLNTHPFQFGPWVFAHNGNLQNFGQIRQKFLDRISPKLQSFILGDTDSEHLFFLLLTLMDEQNGLENSDFQGNFQELLRQFIDEVTQISGPLTESNGDYDKNYLTFLLTNGRHFFAFQGGQPLFFSTHKSLCSERKSCGYFKPICERSAQNGEKIHHLLVSSEIIKNENIWSPLKFMEFVEVDAQFLFKRHQMKVS